MSDPAVLRSARPLSVEAFRAEVRDKLFVVYHGCNGVSNLQRALARNQCEEFLVDLYQQALTPSVALRSALDALREQWRLEVTTFHPFAPYGVALKNCADQLESLLTAIPLPQVGEADFWRCKQCGCLWRDNHNGMVSLASAKQTACIVCEHEPTPIVCEPLLKAVPRAQEKPDVSERVADTRP